MKRLIIFCLLIIYLLEANIAFANNMENNYSDDILKQLNIIDDNYFSKSNIVTRGECIVAIMRTIGATDEEIAKLNGADFIAFSDVPTYSYFGCAYRAKIAFGEECTAAYPTYRMRYTFNNNDVFFFPDRPVTVNETLAFMVRCLGEREYQDFTGLVESANDYGLIVDKDEFIKNDLIRPNEFCTLIKRLLQKKRYKYFGKENNIFRMEGNIDEERSMSYLEMLKLR